MVMSRRLSLTPKTKKSLLFLRLFSTGLSDIADKKKTRGRCDTSVAGLENASVSNAAMSSLYQVLAYCVNTTARPAV